MQSWLDSKIIGTVLEVPGIIGAYAINSRARGQCSLGSSPSSLHGRYTRMGPINHEISLLLVYFRSSEGMKYSPTRVDS